MENSGKEKIIQALNTLIEQSGSLNEVAGIQTVRLMFNPERVSKILPLDTVIMADNSTERLYKCNQ